MRATLADDPKQHTLYSLVPKAPGACSNCGMINALSMNCAQRLRNGVTVER